MKANELSSRDLMIGDWVMFNDKPCQVKGLHNDDTVTLVGYRSAYYLIDAEPILLTPEILYKNGFVYADLPFENFYEGYGLRIYGGNFADGHSNWYIICGINVSMNVTHVHHLQHALKLCGIDKEIVV